MSEPSNKTVQISYFAILKESRGLSEESVQTDAESAGALYAELQERHGLSLPRDLTRVSINDVFASWDTKLQPGDRVAFIPPVSGG